MTACELIDRYLAHSRATNLCCAEAMAHREKRLRSFAAHLGDRALSECAPFVLADWIDANHNWRSPSTRRGVANMVNAAFNWAARQKRIPANPFAGISYPESEPRAPMPDDKLEVLAQLANKPFERALRFLRLTGCRVSEMCTLRWEDVDLERAVAFIPRHKARKRTHKAKLIVLVAEAVELLVEARRGQVGLGTPASVNAEQAGPVFVNNCGRPWTRRTLAQQLARMKKRFGLKDLPATLHGIRHQFGTQAIKNGANLKLLSLQMGHTSTAVTEKFYVHLDRDADALRQAAEAAKPRRQQSS